MAHDRSRHSQPSPQDEGHNHHHRHHLGLHGMQVLEHFHSHSHSYGDSNDDSRRAGAVQRNGVIYTQASDFVLPEEVRKQEISGPVTARPMGDVDLTANDWVLSSGAPSREELYRLKKHAKQTAHMLGTSSKRVLGEAQEDL